MSHACTKPGVLSLPYSHASTLLLVLSAFPIVDFSVLKQTDYLRRHTATKHHSVTLTPLKDL